ncbi:hypothetical protein HDU99_001575, partial [Rhizoclosmatium hyalinum]
MQIDFLGNDSAPATAQSLPTEEEEAIPDFANVFKTFLGKVSTSRGLSALMVRPDFVELFGTSNRDTLIQSVSETIVKLATNSKHLWHDEDLWNLLAGIANSNVDELCEIVLFGDVSIEPPTPGLLSILVKTPCRSLATVDLDRVNSVLEAFLVSEKRKQRVLSQQESGNGEIPLLLTALRNGAGPII